MPPLLSLLFVDHRPAALEELQKSLGILLGRLGSLASETRCAASLAVARGHGYELHHLQGHLVGVACGRRGVGTVIRHQSFILVWLVWSCWFGLVGLVWWFGMIRRSGKPLV